MSNQIVKALEHGAQKLGKTLADDAGKALKNFYRKAGDNLKKVAHNTREADAKHAADLKKILGGGKDGARSPHAGGGGDRGGKPRSGHHGGSEPRSPRLRDGASDPRKTGVRLNSRNTCSDPVDVASGEVVLAETDASLLATLPLVIQRTHVSSYRAGRWFGPSWASTLDQRLEIDDEGVVFATEDGMLLVYPVPEAGAAVLPVEGPRWPLTWDGSAGGTMTVTDPYLGQAWHFSPLPDGLSAVSGTMQLCLQAITDRNGNRIDFLYGASGPMEVRHSCGYRIGIRTQGSRITGLDLLSGGVGSGEGSEAAQALALVGFGYDGNGNLAQVLNSSGIPQEFTYDNQGRITTWTDRNRRRYRYLYDRAGLCVQTRGDGGFLDAVFAYDTEQRTTAVTNAVGSTTLYHLNERGQTVEEVDPLGARSTFSWDRYDRLLASTDPLGRTTELFYDADGNLSHTRRPDGSTSTAAYNDFHQVVEAQLPDGTTWGYRYDERGNLTELIDPDGITLHYARNALGHVIATTDSSGQTSRIEPDAAGLPAAITDPTGATTHCTRDGFGRPLTITDSLGRTTTYTWTVEGQTTARTGPDGSVERWRHDAEGNILEHTDALGATTRFEYTYFDLVSARTDPGGARYEFTYNAELQLARVLNPQGLAWTYDFDAAGRLRTESDFNGRTLTYGYDAAGQLTTRTNGAGQQLTYTYDLLGRPIEQEVDGATTTFAYDPAGRLLTAANPTSRLQLAYDRTGRLLTETCNGRTLSNTYDQLGRRVSRRTPSGASTTWTYNPLGDPTSLQTAGRSLHFTYDHAGREIHRDLGALRISHGWDAADRVISQTLTRRTATVGAPNTTTAEPLQHKAYTLRPDGTPTAVTGSGQGDRSMTLDTTGRITALTGRTWSESYAYDPAGNLLGASWGAPDGHPGAEAQGERESVGTLLRRAGRTFYDYDGQGRVTRQTRRLLSGKALSWHYTWDAEDRLTHLTTPDGARWRYLYDPLGRRIAKQRLSEDLTTVLEETTFTWDGAALAEQTHTTATSKTAHTTTWEWDPETFRPLTQSERVTQLRDAPQDDIDARFYAIVTDLVGTPTELVDESGTIAWQPRTTLWGVPLPSPADQADCPLAFPGQYRDQESGLHYNLFRYYEPLTGRYLSPDPLGLDPAPDPYAYVHNPQTWADPLGLAPCMQGLENIASEIAKMLPSRAQEGQTVAAIHVHTPHGPKIFIAGTSKSKLTPAQRKRAEELGAIPLPNDQYIKVKPGEKGGHAEQNLLLFFNRMQVSNKGTSWNPTHGGASRSVCAEFCAPFIRQAGGRIHGPVHQKEGGTKQRQFYWPGMI
ncbi:hypothetical protein GCM10010193_16700 [Kitasatospora atroaurantiaca]|uniref:RHS repeat-associated protein n=1 Tax=Kitasatospora atroaurantiaca TaxID=285545 RepID=A0A561EXC7_9ACTN|nr:DUF6531 domain-containing protein [Kitasatospora atroaurantiaca]TWE20272.1 RHS repeat-associated protein [Kitasatospora atroaurantiaca]